MIYRLLRKLCVATTAVAAFCFIASAAGNATISATGGLNFRSAASSGSKVICAIPYGTSVSVEDYGSEWSKITYDGSTGYVSSKYLKFSSYTAQVSVSAANIRSTPSSSSACVQTIPNGTKVTVVSQTGNWCSVKYGNITGYIRSDLISTGISNSKTAAASSGSNSAANSSNSSKTSDKRTKLINYAASLLGTPYRSGGASSSGFDCSGFTYYVFSKFGYNLPRGPASQMNALGTKVSKSSLKPGDLVFFKNPSAGRSVGHVGIYVGNGRMIHSNRPGGSVRYVTINSGYYATNYVGARRVIFD